MKKFLLLIRKENSEVSNNYYMSAIKDFGGGVVLAYDSDTLEVLMNKLKMVEGILLPGGDVVGVWDFFLIGYALEHKLKLLGICQGMQSMALYGSNNSLVEIGNRNHKQDEGYIHKVMLEENCLLGRILGEKEVMVNSHHLQTVTESKMFRVVGVSPDLLIEAIENKNAVFQVGVQWHPERMISYDEGAKKIIEAFINY